MAKPKRLMLAAVTKANRQVVMVDVNDAVIAANGWVAGHTMFSNIATTFQIVLPRNRLAGFCARIGQIGVVLDEQSKAVISDLDLSDVAADAEVSASLNITFIHDEPDLKREVPAVPG